MAQSDPRELLQIHNCPILVQKGAITMTQFDDFSRYNSSKKLKNFEKSTKSVENITIMGILDVITQNLESLEIDIFIIYLWHIFDSKQNTVKAGQQ